MLKSINYKDVSIQQLGAGIIATGGFVGFYLVFRDIAWIFFPLVIAMLFLGYHFYERIPDLLRSVWVGITIGIIVMFAISNLRLVLRNYQNPPRWDFQAFWLDGRVASQSGNLYDSDTYQEEAVAVDVDEFFQREVVDTGFKYPPPTALLFFPLGLFGLQTASLLWHGVLVLSIVVNIILLWRYFFPERTWHSLLFTSATVLAIPALSQTMSLGQTMFFSLILTILLLADLDKLRGGIWLALGVFIKPFFAVLGLYYLVRRQWKPIIAVIITGLVALFLSGIVFGFDTLSLYFTDNPNSQVPDYLYTQTVNQSLLATYLRTSGVEFVDTSPVFLPAFILIAGILTVITAVVAYLLPEKERLWGFYLILVLGLLVYPATLYFYSLVLLPLIFFLWQQRLSLPGNVWGIAIATIIIYVLTASNDTVFLAHLFCWILLLLIATYRIYLSRKTLAA